MLWIWAAVATGVLAQDAANPVPDSVYLQPLEGLPAKPTGKGVCKAANRPKAKGGSQAPPPPSAAGPVSQSDADQCLNAHNKARARKGTPPLVWDWTVASHAQSQANVGYGHGFFRQYGDGQK
ncbi:hypothetical protein HDU91_002841 [Kappamyces sp. JEL0680]|nr:hypothetical protein HDU91_002841 [Kappamyces sp. JEL0680]